MPVYTYKVGTVVIEKTICMLHGKIQLQLYIEFQTKS